MNYLGHHVVLDLYGCCAERIADPEFVRQTIHDAAERSGCHIVNECFHEFEPAGVSGCTIISESHFAFHGWHEHGYAAVDLFYCGEHVCIEKAVEHIAERFASERLERHDFARGVVDHGDVVAGMAPLT
jgi:S-adenosylmethionine decarboxylase